MKAAYDACRDAGVSPPSDIWDFFDGEAPTDNGMEVEIDEALSEYSEDSSSGYDLDLSKLPKGIKIIRFYNSW